MLHRETVEPHTLELLIHLMGLEYFDEYKLVGGTALSLQYGHRISVDLYFFGQPKFDLKNFEIEITQSHEINIFRKTKFIQQMNVSNVKVDIVEYPYAWIDDTIDIEGIRMASDKDIAAMKINAITNRGSKKDFVDLYALLKKYSYDEIMSFYLDKYPDGNKLLAVRSLGYFDDADPQDVIILWDVTWEEIKEELTKKYLDHFDNF